MNFPSLYTFEVCIDSLVSAKEAEAGGAHRLELCDNLISGGTTPSYGMIKLCKARSKLPLRVMIRPRGGDFLYTEDEFSLMQEDIRMAQSLGVDGLVFGILDEEGNIDKVRNRQLVELAHPLPCTFHRAFDMCKDPQSALEDIIDLGFDFLLTSGLESNVDLGTPMIKKLVIQSGGRIQIMAGAGIHAQNVSQLIYDTGVQHIHASASHSVASHMKYRNPRLSMGQEGYDEFSQKLTDHQKVADILQQANKAWEAGKSQHNW